MTSPTSISIKELTKRGKEESLLNELMPHKSPTIPSVGEIVDGTIIAMDPTAIYVDIGRALTGVILGREIKHYPRVFRNIAIGDAITAKVIAVENEEGYTELSVKEAEETKRWNRLNELREESEVIETKILDANTGGLLVEIEGTQGFMPVSQLSHEHYPRVEGGNKHKIYQELKEFIGETLRMKVIDTDADDEKLIVSEKAAEQKKLEEELSQYDVGDVVEGTVTGVVDFGAFVKFNDLEGLVHISEMDWQLIEDPHEIIAVGDTVKAKIIDVDGSRVSLSIKALKENPWEHVEERYSVGDIVEGTVTKFNPFGAFIQLDDKIQGLAHISEFGSEEAMRETMKLDETYPFEILSIEPDEYRMALGFRPSGERTTTDNDDDNENPNTAEKPQNNDVDEDTAEEPTNDEATVDEDDDSTATDTENDATQTDTENDATHDEELAEETEEGEEGSEQPEEQ